MSLCAGLPQRAGREPAGCWTENKRAAIPIEREEEMLSESTEAQPPTSLNSHTQLKQQLSVHLSGLELGSAQPLRQRCS